MDCQKFISEFLKSNGENTILKTIDEGKVWSVLTPFLDNHNDFIEIYILKTEDNLRLTDNGYTLANLQMSGVQMNSEKRESIISTVLNDFSVKINSNDEFFVEATTENICQKKNFLLQAILAVNSMFNEQNAA